MARTTRESKSNKRQSIRDKARQAADQREKGQSFVSTFKDLPEEIEWFKPKKGKGTKGANHFSIVPYIVSIENHPFQTAGDIWHECTYWRHVVGTGQDSKNYICLEKTEQSEEKKCPICEYRQNLISNGEDPKLAESLKPKQRQIFNVLDHDNEDKGIQLFDMSPHMFGFMLDDEDKAQAVNFDDKFYGDAVDGLSIKARFNEGSYQGNKFAEIARIDFEERDDLDEDMVKDEAVDLDACLNILSYDELKKAFFEYGGGSEEEEEVDDEPEEKTSKRIKKTETKKKVTRKKVEEDEEDENNNDEDEEPDEEDEEPDAEDEESDSDELECPEGMEFGKDCDTEDCCDECDLWDDCKDLQDEIKAMESKKKSTKTKGKRR